MLDHKINDNNIIIILIINLQSISSQVPLFLELWSEDSLSSTSCYHHSSCCRLVNQEDERKVIERGAHIKQKEQVEETRTYYQEKRHIRSSSLQITTEDNIAYVQAVPPEEDITYGQTAANIQTEENIAYGQTTVNIQTEANIAYGGTIDNFTAEDNVVYYTVK